MEFLNLTDEEIEMLKKHRQNVALRKEGVKNGDNEDKKKRERNAQYNKYLKCELEKIFGKLPEKNNLEEINKCLINILRSDKMIAYDQYDDSETARSEWVDVYLDLIENKLSLDNNDSIPEWFEITSNQFVSEWFKNGHTAGMYPMNFETWEKKVFSS